MGTLQRDIHRRLALGSATLAGALAGTLLTAGAVMGRGSQLLPNARTRSKRASLVLAVGASLAVGLLGPVSPALAASQAITSSGPLTSITITDDLNCAVNHTGDASGEFFGGTACGTLVAVGGTLFGPVYIPAGSFASPRTAFTPVSQSAVTGTGTNADPYRIVTVVGLGSTGLQITETDTYVVGQETYRTDVAIGNPGGSAADAILYRAGDCYLQNSDSGFGAADAATGAVSCVAGVDDGTGTIVPGTRIEQWYPLSAGSSYYESYYYNVWTQIGTQTAFANSCEQCANYLDNGAGLSWNVTIPAGGSVTRSHLTVFSPLGIVPLTTTKTAAQASVSAGASDSYTITITNPNTTAATLTSITDTLPTGFSYSAGSSTGATTTDPGIVGQVLTWTGSFTVPASGSLSLTFGVTVSSTAGDYTNQAGATAESPFVVVGSGQTAPVTVVAAPAHLTLVKTVDNTGGGTALATAWTLSATGPTTISGHTGDAAITNAAVTAGTYTLAEAGGPTGYTPGAWSCTGGTLTGSSLVLAAGGTASCSITNTFTVQSANAKITGGGWISLPTGKTSFGFNVIRDATGLTGQLQVRVKNGKDRFHSTSVLTLNSSGNSGTWTGTGRWDGVGGYTFSVSVVDNGTSGKNGDTISIVIKSPTNVTVFTTGGPQPLKGGNIVVH